MSVRTPEISKKIFQDYIFPCKKNKSPAIHKGTSWQNWTGNITDKQLAGLNCEKADLVVIDFDIYKDEFKKSKESQSFYKEVKRHAVYMQRTQSGGEHFFFKQPFLKQNKIRNSCPFPCVEIRGIGGYVCLYQTPFKFKEKSLEPIKSLTDFSDFPLELQNILKEKKTENTIPFKPGQNNRAIPYRAGKADINKIETDLQELIRNNPGNPELPKHIKDYVLKFINSGKKYGFKNKPKDKVHESLKENEKVCHNWEDIEPAKKEFLDTRTRLIAKNMITVISGHKEAGKTHGIFTLLKSLKKDFIYFSDGDNPVNEIKRTATDYNLLENCHFIKFDKLMKASKDIEKVIDILNIAVKETGHKVIVLDPLDAITSNANDQVKVSWAIGHLQTWACKKGVSIILVKNFNKGEKDIKKLEDIRAAISGSGFPTLVLSWF